MTDVAKCKVCGILRTASSLDEHGACKEGHWIDSANDEAWGGARG